MLIANKLFAISIFIYPVPSICYSLRMRGITNAAKSHLIIGKIYFCNYFVYIYLIQYIIINKNGTYRYFILWGEGGG